jgi:hypothetical protein
VADLQSRTHLEARLKTFDPLTHYLAVSVWDDSFEAFQSLKNIMIDLGFEYRLLLVPDGTSVFDRGGTGNNVQ